ncbi:MAG: phosphoribosyltransferase [Bacteroidetes bacterium]|nr:MAG: phosphoribosyltransferase [Bacteroidota bacterium]
MSKTAILNNKQIEQKINRLAHQVLENNYEESEIIIAGIASRGYVLAKRIAKILQEISSIKVQVAELKVHKEGPIKRKATFPLADNELDGKVIFVVDDVVNSGRTLIYAVRHFLSAPVKKLRTLVLVDRSHNNYPVRADYVGISLATTLQEHVSVEFSKGEDVVYLQ